MNTTYHGPKIELCAFPVDIGRFVDDFPDTLVICFLHECMLYQDSFLHDTNFAIIMKLGIGVMYHVLYALRKNLQRKWDWENNLGSHICKRWFQVMNTLTETFERGHGNNLHQLPVGWLIGYILPIRSQWHGWWILSLWLAVVNIRS